MSELIDIFLHLDTHLAELVLGYGPWVYGILFLIVFAETGLVVTPFLPGDSLLFAAGALAGTGALNLYVVGGSLLVAAIVGDAVNYAFGRYLGDHVLNQDATPRGLHRYVNRSHVARAHEFFERYGGKAVVMGRFVPIVRTFVPFVAGAVSMTYAKFVFYNIAGAVLWVAVCLGAGFAFGNVPVVQRNFSLVALGIVAISLLPIAFELWQGRGRARQVPSRESERFEA